MPSLRVRKLAVCTGIVLLAAQGLSLAETQVPRRGQSDQPAGICDITLVAGGTLRGTVIDAEGIRLPHRTVVVSQRQHVAETRSDARGEFQMTGLQGGLCIVAVDGRQHAYRVWAPGTAPPCAIELLVVGGGDTVRGQLGSRARRQWLVDNAGSITIISAFIALPIVYATKPYGS